MDTLYRFLEAQEKNYTIALNEIKNGHKQSHWMWFIFPQIAGLGLSEVSKFYSIKDIEEAGKYLQHEVLGPRLVEISTELLKTDSHHATEIFGQPDDKKLQSCMTLFSQIEGADKIFQDVLDKFFKGKPDYKTLANQHRR